MAFTYASYFYITRTYVTFREMPQLLYAIMTCDGQYVRLSHPSKILQGFMIVTRYAPPTGHEQLHVNSCKSLPRRVLAEG